MSIRFEKSPCNGCRFKMTLTQGKWRCSLIKITFSNKLGVYKCYSRDTYSARELVWDIVKFMEKERMVKIRDIAKHFGLSYQKTAVIMRDLTDAGVVKVLYRSPKQGVKVRYVLTESYMENFSKAVDLVSMHYPFSYSTLFLVENNRKGGRIPSIEEARLKLSRI